MKSIRLQIDKISYHNKDNVNILLDLNKSEIEFDNLTNINIDISEYGNKRDEVRLGFGANPIINNKIISISQKLSETLIDGIYFISLIKFIYGRPGNENYLEKVFLPNIDFDLKYFHISHETNKITFSQIKKQSNKLLILRENYRNKIIITTSAQQSKTVKEFRVLVFGIGCLIHNSQELNGYTIYPIQGGIEYSNLNNVVNQYLLNKLNFELPFNNQINEEFKKSTPLFVVDFIHVKAVDKSDAQFHCNDISNSIFSILGFKKGQRPNSFATIIMEKGKPYFSYNFQFPGYKGNLVSEFSPTSTANIIDRLYPIVSKNPWMKLIIDNHSYALNEGNTDLKYFRFWAILELIAKKEIPENNFELLRPDNTPIINDKGEILKTDNAFRKVYYYVFNCNFQKSEYSCSEKGYEFNYMFEMCKTENILDGIEKITLWEALNAIYAIRNATAHQGKFIIADAKNGNWKDKLAAKYYPLRFNILLSQLELIVNNVIEKQTNNFA